MSTCRSLWLMAGLAVLLLLGAWMPAHAGPLYATDGAAGSLPTNLYILNPTNGAIESTMGPIHIGANNIRVAGLAFDQATGRLYGSTAGRGTPSPRSLVEIDPSTGAATLIGAFGLPSGTLADIAFHPTSGVLYGYAGRNAGSDLYTVDLATGAATLVGNSGAFLGGGAITFSPSGTLYLAAEADGPLYTVDLTTGALTAGPTLTGASFSMTTGLAFDDAGNLLGINFQPFFGGQTFLVSINPTTGEVTNLGQTPPGLDAITFQPSGVVPSGVPEPSTLVLFGLGLLALAGYGWRRRQRRV